MNRQMVCDYIKKKYRVEPERPWPRFPGNEVFRHGDSKKWFALMMEVPGDRVGLAAADRVDVIDLKVKDCKAYFRHVMYAPGKIEAVARDRDGAEIARSELKTARGHNCIRLTPEKRSLRANGQDLCFLNIDITGQDGITRSSSDQKLMVTVEGAGRLKAFGSARPCMSENFYSGTHTTFYGKALAVIRAGYEPGEITVTVSGEGLESRSFTITVE